MPFQTIRQKTVYSNRFLQMQDNDVKFPDGSPGTYVRISYHGNPVGVVIVPRMPDGHFLLLEVDRYASGETSIEFPRGTGEIGVSVIDLASAELLEETGLSASAIREIGSIRPDAAILETCARVVFAELNAGTMVAQEAEGIRRLCPMSPQELRDSVRSGVITDGFTLGAISFLMVNGLLGS